MVDDSISVQLHLRASDQRGPFYNWHDPHWENGNRCSAAGETENSFNFMTSIHDCEMIFPIPDNNPSGNTETCEPDRYRNMHNFANVIEEKIESCYIKVYAPDMGDNINIAAVSRVGTANEEIISPGNVYGTSINCLRGGFTCIEVRSI